MCQSTRARSRPSAARKKSYSLPPSARRRASSGAGRLRNGGSRDSALGNDQVAGVLVDIDALAAAAVAAGAPHRVIEGGEPAIVREVDVRAFA